MLVELVAVDAAPDRATRAVKLFGVSARGQTSGVPFAWARQTMVSPTYQGCVFAVLVESGGHWNFARRTTSGLEFVDYQSDNEAMQGPEGGATPQMGVTTTDLGEYHTVSFIAFSA